MDVVAKRNYFQSCMTAIEKDSKTVKNIIKRSVNTGIFNEFFFSDEFFSMLIEKNLLSAFVVKEFIKNLKTTRELYNFSNNVAYQYSIENKLITFKEIVDVYSSFKSLDETSVLYNLYDNNDSLQHFIENGYVNREDLKYLLSKVKDLNNAMRVFNNFFFVDHCYKTFVFDDQLIQKFNKILIARKTTFFEQSEYSLKYTQYDDNEHLELYRRVYRSFNKKKDRDEILNALSSSDSAVRTFQNVYENGLLDQYSFKQLIELLIKDDRKKKCKLNF